MSNDKESMHYDANTIPTNTTTDMTNQPCMECDIGKYIEMWLTDDLYGLLHCNCCSHEINRYMKQK
jgi:hypothetical protein